MNFRDKLICLSLLNFIFLFSACQTGKRAEPIDLPNEALHQALKDDTNDFINSQSCLPHEWWHIFHDSQLDHFIETALKNSPNLQSAITHIQFAKATVNKARASLYPNILLGADILREKLSETGIIPFDRNTRGIAAAASDNGSTGAIPSTFGLPPGAGLTTPAPGGKDGIPVYFTQYETELTLTYEFDVWGKNRNLWCAAIGDMKAKIADRSFIQLQLGISVAQVYYRLQTLYQRRELARELIQNKEKFLEYALQIMNSNLGNFLEVQRRKNELLIAKKVLLDLENSIAIDEYQLQAYLAESFLTPIFPIKMESKPLPKIPVPENLPMHLLANRPDITAQLWLIYSAGKQIEVAKVGFYPDFNLFALFGFQTITLSKLFNWKSVYFDVNPAMTLPIFDGGRLLSNLQFSEANYDLAIYQYNQLVLNAAQEVLTALVVLKNTQERLMEFQEMLKHQNEIVHLTELRIAHNLDSGLNFLSEQEILLNNQDFVEVALGETIQAMLLLIKALGGGYDACHPEC